MQIFPVCIKKLSSQCEFPSYFNFMCIATPEVHIFTMKNALATAAASLCDLEL